MNKSRGPTTHHEARTHRVDLDGFSSVGSSGSDQIRQHNTTIGRHAHKMILTRDRWTQLTPLVNITTHATFIQSNLSVSSAILKPSFFLHEQMCERIFRCICSCKADKASSLHRHDCEVVERQECRHGRTRKYVHQVTKAGGDSKFAVVDGAPMALDFRAVEPSWRMVLEAASASRANPRTCRGADGGLPCFQLKEELVDAAEEVEILLPHERAQQWTVDHAPVPQVLEVIEVKLV